MYQLLIEFIQETYNSKSFIPLHAPAFQGNEQQYVADTITSTFVSSVGEYVNRFERDMAAYTQSPAAVAAVNGTAALQVALRLAGVQAGDLVMTQPLTFVATCNAIAYCGAEPVFVDVDANTLGLSAQAMAAWLDEHAVVCADGVCRAKMDERVIRACVPMHTFGHPADLKGLMQVCQQWGIVMVEDAAESLGSLYQGQHTGTFGLLGTLSFNGNKIITTGGGGMLLTNLELAKRAKHLTTTAKLPQEYEYVHGELGYNFRLPNLNAALGCAQLEQLDLFIQRKRDLASRYAEFFQHTECQFVREPTGCRSNYWLNAVVCENKTHRDAFLRATINR